MSSLRLQASSLPQRRSRSSYLEDHVEHCVREAIEDDEKAAELGAAVELFLRV
jgi:DNA-binding FrmR family transcriptional regulator